MLNQYCIKSGSLLKIVRARSALTIRRDDLSYE